MGRKLLLSVSVFALVACDSALAQSASNTSSDTTSSSKVETVVVTAERRTVDLQKASLSATVMSGTDLENKGVLVMDQLQFIAPNVTIDNFGQGSDFDIRGIGKGEHNSQTTPGVITYRDGVATFPGYITEEPYYDVANIQVLRGPQGTFAGQNAIGGAVFVNTQNPVIGGGYDGYVQAQAGNYYDFGLQGASNIPIDDTLAARVAFFGETRSSFYDMTTSTGAKYPGNPGDGHWGAGRLSLLWQPTDKLTVLFKTDVGLLDNGAYPADPYTDRFKDLPGTTTPNPFYTSLFKISANDADQMAQDEYVRSSLKVDYTFDGGIKLQTVTGYQMGNTAYKGDLYSTGPSAGGVFYTTGPFSTDVATFVDNVDEQIWSQEINLISPDTGDFRWIVGAFAQSDRYGFLAPATKNFVINLNSTVPNYLVPYYSYDLSGSNPESDLSVFGQASYELPAGFEVQLGGRYSAVSTVNQNVVDPAIRNDDLRKPGPLVAQLLLQGRSELDPQRGQLPLRLHCDRLQAGRSQRSVRRGQLGFAVRSGNRGQLRGGLEVEPSSTATCSHKSTASTTASTISRSSSAIRPIRPSVSRSTIPTRPSSTVSKVLPRPYSGTLSFDTNIGTTHSSLGTFFASDPRVATTSPCNPMTGPSTMSCVDLKGHQQTYAPDFTFNAGAQYQFKLEGEDTLTPRLSYAHVSGQWATLIENASLGDRLASRDILNAQLAWSHGDYVFTLYGTNLTNDQYVAALNSNLDFAGPPRQYGIRILKVF